MEDYKSIKWNDIKPQLHKNVDQNIYTFDIETSSGYITPGCDHVIQFDYDKTPAFYRDCQKVALCYEWQFGINDQYYYGRELRDFQTVIDHMIKIPGQHYIWIHNAGFELSFLLNLFHPEKCFARKPHQPIYFEYKNLIFRCSFLLANASLKTWAKSLNCPPKIDDYDYDTIRTPYTQLTPDEIDYGQRDLEIVYIGIQRELKEYKFMQNIPLTATGAVRRRVNNLFTKDISYRFKMARLLPEDAAFYARERMCFTGGNVHANWYYADVMLRKSDGFDISAGDIASSYPFCCLTTPLPMSPFRKARDPGKFLFNKKYCNIIEVRFTDLKAKTHIDYISFSKIYDIYKTIDPFTHKTVNDVITENGRVNFGAGFTMTITDLDLDVILRCYECQYEVLNLWYSRAGFLDKRYMNFILDLYYNKTALKGVEGSEDLYMRSKNLLNGIYGDFVTALVYDETELLNNGEWYEDIKGFADIDQRIQELRSKPFKLKSSFAWGVWITAAARSNHFMILELIDKNNDVIYYDTDSVYYLNDHDKDIAEYNKIMVDRINEVLTKVGIDPERSRPADKKGKKRQIGIIEKEHEHMQEFKAIRAKCYGYRDENGKLSITVSGVNKTTGLNALHDDLNNLSRDFVFPYKDCGKKISNYNIDQPVCKWIGTDGKPYISTYKYGLNLQPTQYAVTIPNEFYDVLNALGSLSSHISDLTVDQLKGIAERKN